jgi:hypothetical protein
MRDHPTRCLCPDTIRPERGDVVPSGQLCSSLLQQLAGRSPYEVLNVATVPLLVPLEFVAEIL